MLTLEEGEVLVKAGRVAIESHLSGVETPTLSNVGPGLNEERGVFVTLLDHSRGNGLRGCIGIPLPTRPLLEQVRVAGVEAATTDFRFRPLTLDELRNRIIVEATVLSTLEPLWVRNPPMRGLRGAYGSHVSKAKFLPKRSPTAECLRDN